MNRYFFLKKLKETRPSVLEYYNYDLVPDSFLGIDLLKIECPNHGVFEQKAYGHMYGAGCPECGKEKAAGSRSLTTDVFVKRSLAKFGNRFSYSKTIYLKKAVN